MFRVLFLLCALRKVSKRSAAAVEATALTVPILLACTDKLSPQTAPRLRHNPAVRVCQAAFFPAVTLHLARLAIRLLRITQPIDYPPEVLLLPGVDSSRESEPPEPGPRTLMATDGPLGLSARARSKGPLPPLPPPLSREAQQAFTAPQLCQAYPEWVDLFRNVLRRRAMLPLPRGFDADGYELARFLLSSALHKARTPVEAERAVARAVERLQQTLGWWRGSSFLPAMQLAADWSQVAWWEGPIGFEAAGLTDAHTAGSGTSTSAGSLGSATDAGASGSASMQPAAVVAAGGAASPSSSRVGWLTKRRQSGASRAVAAAACPASDDQSQCLWLCLNVSEALASMQMPGCSAQQSADAVVSQIEFGMRNLVRQKVSTPGASRSSAPVVSSSGRIVVLIDCGGVNIRVMLRLLGLLKTLAVTLHRHYPGRLKALYLVNLPAGVLRLSLETILALLPIDTRRKIRVCSVADLPPRSHSRIAPPVTDLAASLLSARAMSRATRGPAAGLSGYDGHDGALGQLAAWRVTGFVVLLLLAVLALWQSLMAASVVLPSSWGI